MQWIVTLRVIDNPEVCDVVEVEGEDATEAIDNAFFTRNIASSWQITEILGEVRTAAINRQLPLSFDWWHRFRRLS